MLHDSALNKFTIEIDTKNHCSA